MTEQDKEKAMADKDAVQEMLKTPGWKVFYEAAIKEEERLAESALNADDPIKCFALMKEVRGIRNHLQQIRWIIEKGTKIEKEAH